MAISYTRTFARNDVIEVINTNGSWNIERPADPIVDPTILWLDIDGDQRLMQYDWDADSWSDVTP